MPSNTTDGISPAAVSTPCGPPHPAGAALLLGALGVVFGDIGTSGRVAWISGKGALTPTPFGVMRMRTNSGRPSSSMRFSAWTATSTSVARRWSVRQCSATTILSGTDSQVGRWLQP